MNGWHQKRVPRYIFGSLLLHFSIWASLTIVQNLSTQTQGPSSGPVEIVILDSNEISSQSQDPDSPPLQRERQAQQIVQQDEKSLHQTPPPEDTRFLSRDNQRVDEETRASHTGTFVNTQESGQSPQGAGSESPEPLKAAQTEESQMESAPASDPIQELIADTTPTSQAGDLKLSDLRPQFQPKAPTPSLGSGPSGQASQTDDYLKDLKPGLHTMLNTREFVYYSYYSRIREQIRQHWEPNVREKVKILYRTGRSPASPRDRVTQLMITLDPQGYLVGVDVIGQSGVIELDDAAIEAFRAAAPFPNPPQGMVESDGTIKIRWDFILEAQWTPEREDSKLIARSTP